MPKIILYIINIGILVTLIIWPFLVFLSAFIFDEPGSEQSIILNCLFYSILLYPVSIILGNVLFWKNLKKVMLAKLTWYTSINFINPLILVTIFIAAQFLV